MRGISLGDESAAVEHERIVDARGVSLDFCEN
jgi:hypothetical protein